MLKITFEETGVTTTVAKLGNGQAGVMLDTRSGGNDAAAGCLVIGLQRGGVNAVLFRQDGTLDWFQGSTWKVRLLPDRTHVTLTVLNDSKKEE